MRKEKNDSQDCVKRIVLVGYPGSGKTMLAIGLYSSSQCKGATMSVKDPRTSDTLSRAVAGIRTHKKFAAATQIIKGASAEQTERKTYSFEFPWRGERFRIEFEDYAGERLSNPAYIKQFDDIIGTYPYGAILLLNPGMKLFKPPRDIPEDIRESEVKKRAALPKFYTAAVDELREKGCKNFVLAVTASDRISKGGDLCRTEQYRNFKEVLEEIRLFLKNARRKYGRSIDFKIVYVTVTGRLKYNENGEPEEERLAGYGKNTAADPFLWIIDPWRMRLRKFIKRVSWVVPSAALLLAGLYFGGQAAQRHEVESNLDKAEDLLGKFVDTETADYDKEKGANAIAEAEACLKHANEASTFLVSDVVKANHGMRLSALLGTLMTNQVELAYANSKPDDSTYTNPNRTLEGRPEFALWSYWARSPRGKAVHDAVLEFRDQKTEKLVRETLSSTVKYLVNEFDKIIKEPDDKDPDDATVNCLLVQACRCLSRQPHVDKLLRSQRDECLKVWKKKLASRIEQDGTPKVMSRIIKTITEDTGLNAGDIQEDIFVSYKKEMYTAYKTRAEEFRRKIEGTRDPQTIATQLTEYLNTDANSPYKWFVLEAAGLRCNKVVADILSSSEGRKENFDSIFQAARHLGKALDKKTFCEGQFGDNVLYWLAQTINKDGARLKTSSDWLRYTFHCDAVAVRTDHASNNHGSERFAQNVDAQLTLSFEPQQDGYPRDIGEEGLLRYAENGGERDIGESESWIPIPNSSIDVEMGAADVLKIRVQPGEENWKWDVAIPGCTMDFWPGWGNHESAFTYESKRDIYPQDAYYGVCLLNVRLEGGPKRAFDDALEKANARERGNRAKWEKEVSDADRFLKSQEGGGHE